MKTLKIMFSLHIFSWEKADFFSKEKGGDISRKSTPLKKMDPDLETAH